MSSQKLLCRVLLVFACAALPVAPAAAQVSEPEFVPYVNDMQAFDQPDLSSYGRGPQPTAGYFGSAEFLYWTQVAPKRSLIGEAGTLKVITSGASTTNSGTFQVLVGFGIQQISSNSVTSSAGNSVITTTYQTYAFSATNGNNLSSGVGVTQGGLSAGAVSQSSSLDTTFMSSADFTSGGRFEFGHVDEDGRGWMASGFSLASAAPDYTASNASVNFENSPVGFVDFRGVNTLTPDGIDDDLDHDGSYGRFGADLGTPWNVPTAGVIIQTAEPLDGVPDFRGVTTDFDDAAPLPTKFVTLRVSNKTMTSGVELMKMWRLAMGPRGGVWELFVGPRGLNVNDQFGFFGMGQAGSVGTSFATNAQNYILAAQFGGRWSHTAGRWQVGLEGRMLAGANYQHVTQGGEIGSVGFGVTSSQVTNVQLPTRFSHTANQTEFAPGGELRLNLKYHLFRSLHIQGGYTALYVGGIARGSMMNHYSLPSMGLLDDNNKSGYFLHGLNLGLVFNH